MEFGKSKLKWYWLLLFIVYSIVVIYELFHNNPYLYSHYELRSILENGKGLEIKPFPTPSGTRETGEILFYPRWSFSHSGIEPKGMGLSKNLVERSSTDVQSGIEDWNVEKVSSDLTGFYLSGKSNWVVAVDLDGSVRWKFLFENERPQDLPVWQLMIDATTVYAVHPKGEVVALDKATGRVIWDLPLNDELVAAPFLWKDAVVLPHKFKDPAGATSSSRPGVQWMYVSRDNGTIQKTSDKIDVKFEYQVVHSADLKQFIFTSENKIFAVDDLELKPVWNQVLTDPIKDSAIVYDSQIYLATMGAKLMNLDGNRKGRVVWEYDLEKPPATSPSYLPVMNRLSIKDESGAVFVVDAKNGKGVSKLSLENQSLLEDTWSAKVKTSYIEEFKMDWLHKGWTVWTACGGKKVCILTPKGMVIAKLGLGGQPMALPIVNDGQLAFFVKVGTHKYGVTRLMDEKELNKLKAEQAKAKAAEESSPSQ